MKNKKQRAGLGILGAAVFMSLAIFSCQKRPELSGGSEAWCELNLSDGNTASKLGAIDYNAGYSGIVSQAREGERLVLKGNFAKARYSSVMIYDRDFMPVDAITDFEIAPIKGVNPFGAGNPRQGELGEFEIQVLMTPPPARDRPANTLYAGIRNDGKKNDLFVLAYRVYLPDQGLGFRDHHPLARFGGVEPPKYKMIDQKGNPYCLNNAETKLNMSRVMLAILKLNQGLLADPMKYLGEPENPPQWINNASDQTQRENTFVPNDDTRYLALPVSNKFGELLVLRWKAAQTPEQTFLGEPFPKSYDLRYWSLSFNYIDLSRPLKVYAEKTLADVDVPVLPDGTRQVVIGFGGMEKPAAVAPEQWVSVKWKEGMIIMRNILITPGSAGDFGKIPAGKISRDWDQYTPGGVYCSVDEFAKNPEIGLDRAKLLPSKNIGP